MKRITTALLLFCVHPAFAVDPNDTLLLAEPDISREHIAFVYEATSGSPGDGSAARRLTTAEGLETRPHFSPDGRSIVFSSNYDGNVDVYPIEGGAPKRLSWHGGDDIAQGSPAGNGCCSAHSVRRARTASCISFRSTSMEGSSGACR